MERIVAYCGLICTVCPAFVAAKADGLEDVEEVAAQWRYDYTPGITADDVYCQGCPGEGGRKCAHCAECAIRACAVACQVANCGVCPDYGGCAKILKLFDVVPEARAVLEEMATGERRNHPNKVERLFGT